VTNLKVGKTGSRTVLATIQIYLLSYYTFDLHLCQTNIFYISLYTLGIVYINIYAVDARHYLVM